MRDPELAEITLRLTTAGKSAAAGIAAMAAAAAEAGRAMREFRVACYPKIPPEDHPIRKQMQAVADAEGKELVLIEYPRQIPQKVFGQTWIVYDEFSHLDWYRRRVVMWRGKKMVYRHEIRLH